MVYPLEIFESLDNAFHMHKLGGGQIKAAEYDLSEGNGYAKIDNHKRPKNGLMHPAFCGKYKSCFECKDTDCSWK